MEPLHQDTTNTQKKEKPVFPVWQGLALVAHITGYILGPLVVIGGVGFWLDRTLHGRRFIFLASMLVAFVIANYLVYKKATDISKRFR